MAPIKRTTAAGFGKMPTTFAASLDLLSEPLQRVRAVQLTLMFDWPMPVGHLRGARVVCEADGQPLSQKVVQVTMRRVARRATVKAGVHILRHTFCSHLAMRGAPARAIQELAGHQDLATTQRYMHLSPAALEARSGSWTDLGGARSWRHRGGGGTVEG